MENSAKRVILIVLLLVVAFFVLITAFESVAKEVGLRDFRRDLLETVGVKDEDYSDAEIINRVAEHVEIDTSKEINVAFVNEPDQLKKENPQFYANAKKGHYLLVLPFSQQVILYDINKDKIINFGNYSVGGEAIRDEDIPEAERPLRIEIRKTDEVSDAEVESVKKVLTDNSIYYEITEVTTTENEDWGGIVLVLLNKDAKPTLSQNLVAHVETAQVLSAVPEGEQGSEADAVIILAK